MNLINKMKFNGSWYPENASELSSFMEDIVKKSVKLKKNLRGAVLPGSAYLFSGKGIAPFFNNVDRKTRHVFLFVPSHNVKLESDSFYFGDFSQYETPFGLINADTSVVSELRRYGNVLSLAVEKEHSAEIFYPFIKYFVPDASITVIAVPKISSQERLFSVVNSFFSATEPFIDADSSIFIASSDFTHYGKRFAFTPFGSSFGDSYNMCRSNDIRYIDNLISYNFDSIFKNMKSDVFNVYGVSSALFVSRLMQLMNRRGVMAEYYNSNDFLDNISDDYICYSSILFG